MAKYAVLGVGALGGLYGGQLANSGQDVAFLARSDYAVLKSKGLRVESPTGDFLVHPVNVFASVEDMPQADVVLVTWKATSNEMLRSALEQICHADSLVLVLQNGLGVEEDAAQVVGLERVLGGCCFLCSNKVGPGHIRHLDHGRIVFAEADPRLAGTISTRMRAIEVDFRAAGIDVHAAEDLRTIRWRKLAWNIPFNGLSVALDANTREIMENRQACQLATDLVEDVRRSAEACGVTLSPDGLKKMLEDTREMVPYDSSMLLDYRAGRPMEIEVIVGNPLRAAQANGYAAPRIEMLYLQLKFLAERKAEVSEE